MIEDILRLIITVFLVCVFARSLLSFFPVSEGTISGTAQRWCVAVTDPVLAPVRKLLPPVNLQGGMLLDLSPMIVMIICLVLLAIL